MASILQVGSVQSAASTPSTGPTPPANDNSTNLATTAFVQSEKSLQQQSKSANYTLVLTDANKHLYHPSADTTGRTWTIPANSSVPFPIGSTITFVNDVSAGTITLTINSDTLVLAETAATGSRNLAACGIATAIKMTATRWMISGVGLT